MHSETYAQCQKCKQTADIQSSDKLKREQTNKSKIVNKQMSKKNSYLCCKKLRCMLCKQTADFQKANKLKCKQTKK